jgi:hypothetical protein
VHCSTELSLSAGLRPSPNLQLSSTHARDRSVQFYPRRRRRRTQIDRQLTKVDPRRRHGKRPLPAAEVEEEEALPPGPPPAKHEQLEEPHHVISQLQGATFSGGGGSSSSSVVGGPSPAPQAYAQYYYSARADNDASAVASALAHVIRASPDHLPPQPQQAAALYGAGGLRQGQGQGHGDHPQAAAHHYPGGHHVVAAAEEEQGTRT